MPPLSGEPGEHTPLLTDTRIGESSDMAPQTELPASLEGGDGTVQDEELRIRRILRKVDWRLIPLLFFTYMLNFMDKTILSSASVFGLIDDTVSVSLRLATRPS